MNKFEQTPSNEQSAAESAFSMRGFAKQLHQAAPDLSPRGIDYIMQTSPTIPGDQTKHETASAFAQEQLKSLERGTSPIPVDFTGREGLIDLRKRIDASIDKIENYAQAQYFIDQLDKYWQDQAQLTKIFAEISQENNRETYRGWIKTSLSNISEPDKKEAYQKRFENNYNNFAGLEKLHEELTRNPDRVISGRGRAVRKLK